jgi:hypothetical protein
VCFSLFSQHLAALQACLDADVASSLAPLLLDTSTRMAAYPAVQTVCKSERGRSVLLAWALGEGQDAMRSLARCVKNREVAADLVGMLKSPLSDAQVRGIALGGLEELLATGSAALINEVPFVAETLADCPETLAGEIKAALLKIKRV